MIEGKGQDGVAAGSEVGGQSERVDSGGGGGGNKEDVLSRKDDKERLKAERGRRILNTLDLVDTLVGGYCCRLGRCC